MEIIGKIIQVLPLQQGTSKSGNPWKKQEYVLETQENYPKKVKFDFFGERADQYPLQLGDDVRVSFDLESREFNGRWYTDVRGWKAEKITAEQIGTTNQPQQFGADALGIDVNTMPQFDNNPGGNTDDLPF